MIYNEAPGTHTLPGLEKEVHTPRNGQQLGLWVRSQNSPSLVIPFYGADE